MKSIFENIYHRGRAAKRWRPSRLDILTRRNTMCLYIFLIVTFVFEFCKGSCYTDTDVWKMLVFRHQKHKRLQNWSFAIKKRFYWWSMSYLRSHWLHCESKRKKRITVCWSVHEIIILEGWHQKNNVTSDLKAKNKIDCFSCQDSLGSHYWFVINYVV